jgi:hypothetical protein
MKTEIKIGQAEFSKRFFYGSILMYTCGLFTLISFASPYWSQSYPSTGNEFKNIGLWEACLYRYRHWKDDNQKPYTGCFWFWSPDMIRFRDWLMPCKYEYLLAILEKKSNKNLTKFEVKSSN